MFDERALSQTDNSADDVALPKVRFCLFCNHPVVLEPGQQSSRCAGCGMLLRDATFMLTSELLGEFDFDDDTVVDVELSLDEATD